MLKKGSLSIEIKQKISKALKGRKFSEEHKRKISEARKGMKFSEITKEKLRRYFKGRKKPPRSKEYRENIRKAHLGMKQTEVAKRKLSLFFKGRKIPKEILERKKANYRKENHPNWQGGKSFEAYGELFNQQLKDKVRTRDNFICQNCGVPELECQERLHVHHIDYNKKNSDIDNLISLCRSCHVKTNYNRLYWQEKWTHYLKTE